MRYTLGDSSPVELEAKAHNTRVRVQIAITIAAAAVIGIFFHVMGWYLPLIVFVMLTFWRCRYLWHKMKVNSLTWKAP